MGQLEDLQVFVRVVEAGGIGRAATQLGMAKSAVSRRLSELEARLGLRLINRTTRKSNLTEAGRAYYQRAGQVLDDVAEMNAMTSDADASLQGTMHLAVPLSFGLSHLAPALDDFIQLYPKLVLNFDFSDRHVDLVEEGFDVGFRIADMKDSSLKARVICPIRHCLCASPEYLSRFGKPTVLEDLKDHRWLRYQTASSALIKLIDEEQNEHRVRMSSTLIANNGDFLNQMAIAGHGIVISPTFISWQALKDGKLVRVLKDYSPPQMKAYAVYPQTRYLSQRVRLLIDFLVERFGDNPYWDKQIEGV